MSDECKFIAEPIKPGQIVYLDDQGLIRLLNPGEARQPIGTARRDIAKGETVIYSPGHTTDDIEAVIHM